MSDSSNDLTVNVFQKLSNTNSFNNRTSQGPANISRIFAFDLNISYLSTESTPTTIFVGSTEAQFYHHLMDVVTNVLDSFARTQSQNNQVSDTKLEKIFSQFSFIPFLLESLYAEYDGIIKSIEDYLAEVSDQNTLVSVIRKDMYAIRDNIVNIEPSYRSVSSFLQELFKGDLPEVLKFNDDEYIRHVVNLVNYLESKFEKKLLNCLPSFPILPHNEECNVSWSSSPSSLRDVVKKTVIGLAKEKIISSNTDLTNIISNIFQEVLKYANLNKNFKETLSLCDGKGNSGQATETNNGNNNGNIEDNEQDNRNSGIQANNLQNISTELKQARFAIEQLYDQVAPFPQNISQDIFKMCECRCNIYYKLAEHIIILVKENSYPLGDATTNQKLPILEERPKLVLKFYDLEADGVNHKNLLIALYDESQKLYNHCTKWLRQYDCISFQESLEKYTNLFAKNIGDDTGSNDDNRKAEHIQSLQTIFERASLESIERMLLIDSDASNLILNPSKPDDSNFHEINYLIILSHINCLTRRANNVDRDNSNSFVYITPDLAKFPAKNFTKGNDRVDITIDEAGRISATDPIYWN